MGASEWSRKVPYQTDIAATLRRAREDAYREGVFCRAEPDLRAQRMGEEEYAAAEVAALRDL